MTTAAELTATVLAPVTSRPQPGAGQMVRDRLVRIVPGLVAPLRTGQPLVVSLPTLRHWAPGGHPDPGRLDEPFAWKPRFVRRSLGLAAIDTCLSGAARTPLEAVGAVADRAVSEWQRSGWRTFHWEPWLASLGTGGRSAVLAEAATWATGLWTALDWEAFHPAPRLGGSDDQWVCPAPHPVRLKGRSEVQIALPSKTGVLPDRVLVSVSGGTPRAGADIELGYLALVAALRSPTRPPPVRVVGLWPDAGRARSVEVSAELLVEAGDAVLRTIASLAVDAEPRRAPEVGEASTLNGSAGNAAPMAA